jgi:hypothetical protein
MKKKLTLEELEKRIEALENNRIIYIQPQFPPYSVPSQCTCGKYNTICPIHGFLGNLNIVYC